MHSGELRFAFGDGTIRDLPFTFARGPHPAESVSSYPLSLDPGDVALLVTWVLRCPYLVWSPNVRGCPRLRVVVGEVEVEYEISAVLGAGGYGIVFEGRHDGTSVAIKVPHRLVQPGTVTDVDDVIAELRAADPDAAERRFDELVTNQRSVIAQNLGRPRVGQCLRDFEREGRLLKRLRHPGVVRLRHTGTIGFRGPTGELRLPCFVMDKVDGTPVGRAMSVDDPVTREELGRILDVVWNVAMALASVHDHDIAHRDISWNNVFLVDSAPGIPPHPVVIDLGNATGPGFPDRELLDVDTIDLEPIAFTPRFEAPEVHGTTVVGPAADQFSLGVILYRWCCRNAERERQWPYEVPELMTGDPRPPAALHTRFVREGEWASGDGTRILSQLSRVVDRMIAPHPDDRFPNLRDAAAVLWDLRCEVRRESDPIGPDELGSPSFDELCRQLGVTPDVRLAVAFLQLTTHQSRISVQHLIRTLWAAVRDAFDESDEFPSDEAAVGTVARQVVDLHARTVREVAVIQSTFGKSDRSGSMAPRFGRRFEWLIHRAFADSAVASLGRTGTTTRLADDSVDALLDVVNSAQRVLEQLDHDLSAYSRNLRRVDNVSESND